MVQSGPKLLYGFITEKFQKGSFFCDTLKCQNMKKKNQAQSSDTNVKCECNRLVVEVAPTAFNHSEESLRRIGFNEEPPVGTIRIRALQEIITSYISAKHVSIHLDWLVTRRRQTSETITFDVCAKHISIAKYKTYFNKMQNIFQLQNAKHILSNVTRHGWVHTNSGP